MVERGRREGCSPQKDKKRLFCLLSSSQASQHFGKMVTILLPHKGMVSTFCSIKHPALVSLQAVVERSMGTAAPSPAPAIRTRTQTTLIVNGPSLHLLEDLSLSAFTLSALMIPETVSRTTSSSMTDQMLIPHPLDHFVEQ